MSDHSQDDTVARYSNRHRRQRAQWRTKSMPSDVNEFIQSFNSNSNNNGSQYYERSKSADILNHQGEQSAFSIYNDDDGMEQPQSISLLELDEDEVFVDSPIIVDYQLGRRHSLPSSPSPTAYSQQIEAPDHLATELTSNNCDSHDEEVTETLQSVSSQSSSSYRLVRAEPVILGTPQALNESSVVHATPIQLETPCPTLEQEQPSPTLASHVSIQFAVLDWFLFLAE